ncbi:probable phospholipid-transporting ATPase IIB isoform X2 [Schistocerca gregaria]|uniref:probable phospholipid-transporting ATPase IIB isoform X2 n=1 Tax=Schistocerca gregaria TaxID=7010 RepID=UPI00211F30B6|nr:probable phospholipid-transporting ATPase IIB isoform X2 [Schistocerca gregaria]
MHFKFFFNTYFLLIGLAQLIPALRVGYIFTNFAPLVLVLTITIGKEAYDDYQRRKRDEEANSKIYYRHTQEGLVPTPSSELKVGDIIEISTDQSAPADLVLLKTTEKSGGSFVRTDQLDGETDWKLRKAILSTQGLSVNEILQIKATLYAEVPRKEIYEFVGTFSRYEANGVEINESLSLENTVWADTVVASGTIYGMVIYTGTERRSSMNTSQPKSKVGKLDYELDFIVKCLFALVGTLALSIEALDGFRGNWVVLLMRYIVMFSSIIPVSLRVNLDMGRLLYSYLINRDHLIPGTIVRNSAIPEELGRIGFLLTDKTGTLTKNEMVFKRLHLGSVVYNQEVIGNIATELSRAYESNSSFSSTIFSESNRSKEISQKVLTAITAISVCHTVSSIRDEIGNVTYQGSSPDEVALVKLTDEVGMVLDSRSSTHISIRAPDGQLDTYEILSLFPFTSELKRMGIVVRSSRTGQITFYAKGADVSMSKIVKPTDWLDEECSNMAREGLRTLVFGMRHISNQEYESWSEHYNAAKLLIQNREKSITAAIEKLEHNLQVVCITGVEDKLQQDVKPTMEKLRNAGIKIWMLTGDKVETAICIAISARMVMRQQSIYQMIARNEADVFAHLNAFALKKDTALVIDGGTLQICLDNCPSLFIDVAAEAPAVVCCRCSPTQKAGIVKLVKEQIGVRTCAIGDGGNDVSMIQNADVGLGIVGCEGRQASLAADFSINQFSFIAPLLFWHGRNSYRRSARLAQFIIHRGLVIAFIQAIFSATFYFSAIPIYNGWLTVGYTTAFTCAAVFSLVLDTDVSRALCLQYPELYQELQKGRNMNLKVFFIWIFISIYQAGMIMLITLILFNNSLHSIVTITYTALIFAQLLNIAFEIYHWDWRIIATEIGSFLIYAISIVVLKSTFDVLFIFNITFIWKILVITSVATIPIYIVRFVKKKCDPPAYSKLSG